MATSGNITFEQTRNQIIRTAFEHIRVAIEGEDLTAEQMQKGAVALNSLMKFWQAQGFHLWKLNQGWLFAKAGQYEYQLGAGGDLCASDITHNTTLYKAYQGYTQVYLKDGAKLPSAGDYICLNINGQVFSSTVTAVADNAVTINDMLPCDICPNADVWFFSKLIDRPLKIIQARRAQIGGTEIEMVNMAMDDYFRLPDKAQQGTPTSWNYQPTLERGTFRLWNAPYNNSFIIKFTYEQGFDIFEVSKDMPDIAPEWIEPLTWELAYRLSPYGGLELDEREWIKAQAKETLEQARNFDQETGGFQITPNERGY